MTDIDSSNIFCSTSAASSSFIPPQYKNFFTRSTTDLMPCTRVNYRNLTKNSEIGRGFNGIAKIVDQTYVLHAVRWLHIKDDQSTHSLSIIKISCGNSEVAHQRIEMSTGISWHPSDIRLRYAQSCASECCWIRWHSSNINRRLSDDGNSCGIKKNIPSL